MRSSPQEQMPEREHNRLAQPVDLEEPPHLAFPVIGIGASAGGLEAALDFVKSLPPSPGMAFILVQHLPPDRESMLVEIISKHVSIPVLQVQDAMPVESDHFYVIRPGHTLTLKQGHFHLGEPLEKPGHRHPVDDFFRSLAEEQRERAVCIILSGMGSNGTAGANDIKAVGGVCIAQDPESAKFPAMPRNLIDAGLADFILSPKDMPDVLQKYAQHPYAKSHSTPGDVLRAEQSIFNEILSLLRSRARQEFGGYKKPTVLRRIQRRMGLHQIVKLSEYAKFLRQNPSEASSLADDLVIHVTGFFRDPEAWEALRQHVIEPLIAEHEPDSTLRAWVTACSSGEEAYTLAILLVEAAQAAGKPMDIKIFATDLASRMLHQARNGTYPLGIDNEISEERLSRFFEKDDSCYRIKKEIRELVVFAPQNVLQDPPFSRLDICTCRNLMIYLEPDIQRRVLSLLHFGLKQGGTLFLGNSETVAESEGLFEVLDKKWRIYRRVGPPRHAALEFPVPPTAALLRAETDFAVTNRNISRNSIPLITQRKLLELYSPPAVVVDRQSHVVYFHGDTSPFLLQPAGEPTRELLAMARENVRATLRIALHKAMQENQPVTIHHGHFPSSDGPSLPDKSKIRIAITCSPLHPKPNTGYFLVSFELLPEAPAPPPDPAAPADSSEHHRTLNELHRVRDELQSTVQELQTSNEELKASNEEVTSINEELQSTNEELETSKEELQSLNEELNTVNSQLQAKMEELENTSSDLSSLLASINIAVIFLDSQF
ncbi:MAG TPA: chemotaxis protein CheB, partial [Phycisphaerae bacterium]